VSADPRFELQLLGGFDFRSTQSHDAIVISTKKARALLAYVAMHEPMRVSRERLATLFWPDRADRQARQNLRKCIASLRQDLASFADELLTTDGETVGIRNVLAVDARRLRAFCDTNETADLEHAAALYRGPFLADVTVEGEEFRDWVAAERAQLEAAAGTILSKLASRADASGDAQKALQASSRLISIDAFREDWLRLGLTIAARHVGRDKALTQARDFARLLRQELGVEPEAETVELIERIKAGRIAPLRNRDVSKSDATGCLAGPGPVEDQAAAVPGFSTPANAIRPAMVSAIVAALVAVLVASLFVAYRPGDRGWLKPASRGTAAIDTATIPLLILPVQSETAETAQLAHALTANLLTSVSRFSELTVFDGSSTGLDPSGGDAERPSIRFAARGTVRRQGSAIHLNVGLSDTTNRTLVWADDIAVSDDGAASPQAELPKRVARDLQVQATYAQARGINESELNLAATNQLVARALTIQYGGSALAAPLYEEVLRRDRNTPLALIGLAADLITSSANLRRERQSALAQAETLIGQALQINPRIERAYYWLGIIYLGRGERELAMQSFDRALNLNPAFIPAEAHAGFALVLSGHTTEGLGRIENALAANAHDPNERLWLRFAGIAHLELGNNQQAIDSLLAAASLAAPTAPLRAALASAYALTGQRSKSQEQFRLMKAMADPAALDRLLKTAVRNGDQHGSRYLEGLRLASLDAL
jgi:DNA-binding SARP family transcriptional activator/TolB-like protein/Flp pilus assembly protein TadD